MTPCPHCGQPMPQVVERPEGCVCDPRDWIDSDIEPICDKFIKDDLHGWCARCFHDYACHAEAKESKR